jgi:MOSC domain-containing protein YiiM
VARETCPECRFDSDAYTDDDVSGALRALAPWWDIALRDRGGQVFARPVPTRWSAFEYLEHTREVFDLLKIGIDLVLAEDGVRFPTIAAPPVAAEPSHGDVAAAIARLDMAARALELDAIDATIAGSPHTGFLGDGTRVTVAWLLRHAVHDALHHLHDIGRGFVALGAGVTTHVGVVEQVNVSNGGVPKSAVPAANASYRGLSGDRQASRKHHGRVFQAVCLFSTEAIARLRDDGHPIDAGAAGENLTLSGLRWSELRPGTRLRIGAATVELSVPAVPCARNARWFSDGDFDRLHYDRHPGEARWYASVMVDGEIRTGDAVVVEPA